MLQPISPKDIKVRKIPDFVIEAFNELIASYWDGKSSTFKQDDVVKLIIQKSSIERNEIFSKRLLDIETLFKDWDVDYDKPAYGEDYEARFTFKPKGGKR